MTAITAPKAMVEKTDVVMFRDRVQAGKILAKNLAAYSGRDDVLVLGIPRGGVPVAFEVAQALHAPLDILLSRKLGAPGQEELAMGAVSSGGVRILDRPLIQELGVSEQQLEELIAKKESELRRREEIFRDARPQVSVQGKIAILVDDGIATGSSVRAAIAALRTLHPSKIVVAAPVAPARMEIEIGQIADEFVCPLRPEWFYGIGQFYEDFSPTEDAEVRDLLIRAKRSSAVPHGKKVEGAA